MPTLTVYRTRFTDVADGDYVSPDISSEEIELDTDEGDELIPDAVKILRACGCVSPSSSGFHAGLYYTDPDGSQIISYGTGEREACSVHLSGFDLPTQEAIFNTIQGNK